MKTTILSILMFILSGVIATAQPDTPLWSFPFDSDPLTDKMIDFSPDCKYIACGSDKGNVILHNLLTGMDDLTYNAHSGQAICVKFNPDGNLLASGGKEGTIKIYDIINKKDFNTINAHDKAVMCLSFSPDGTKLFSGSRDNTVKVWDIATGKMLLNIQDIKGNVRSIQFNPDGKSLILATSALSKGVRLFNLSDGREIKTLESANTQRIDVSPNAFYLAAAMLDKKIFIWDLRTNTVAFKLIGHTKNCDDVAFSPGGKMLASSSNDNTVILWDIEKASAIHTFIGHTDNIVSLAYSNDGTMLASAGWDKTIKVWNLRPYTKELVKEAPVVSIGVTLEKADEEAVKKAFDNLTFETGSAVIAKTSYPSLDELAKVLEQKKEFLLLIDGHTDNVGADDKNLALSISRAESVKTYLVSKGIEEKRLTSNGYGAKRPIADNTTEEGRKQNRRVEMKIVN